MIYYAICRSNSYTTHTDLYFCSNCGKSWVGEQVGDRAKCPHCGHTSEKMLLGVTPYYQHDVVEKAFPFVDVIDGTTIRGKTFIVSFEYEKNGPALILKKEEVRKYKISIVPSPSFELEIDGVPLRPTKSNIKKALAYVSTNKLDNTIFGVLRVYTKEGSDSLATAVEELVENPWIEKLYNAGDKRLWLYRNMRIDRDLIDANEPSLIKALHINRSLFSFLLQNGKLFSHVSIRWKTVMDLVNRYNIQVTEQILRLFAENMQTPRFIESYEDRKLLGRYLVLLLMDGVQYDYERLMSYLVEDLYTYQGIESPSDGAQLLIDYIEMCHELGVPFEKYPKSLKLVHDIAAKNQKEVIDEIHRRKFSEAIDTEDYQRLQYTGKDYMVISPKCPDDLVIEGAALSHCVGSYINKVINHTAMILFMRSKSMPNKAMITLDVRKGHLYQAAGYDNRQLTADEREFVAEWGKVKHIDCSGFC